MSLRTSQNCNGKRTTGNGFTLIEVLVAVSLLAVIMTLVWTTTSQSLRARERIEARSEVYHEARVTLAKIQRDFSMAFLVLLPEDLGKKGDHVAMKTAFHGQDSGKEDSVYFDSMDHLRLFRSSRESETCEVGYKVEKNSEDSHLFQLMRRESPWVDEHPDEGGDWIVLSDHLTGLNLEYYDATKKEWTGEWNSESDIQKNRLPRAVRITITLPDPDQEGEDLTFQTVALVEMYKDAIDF